MGDGVLFYKASNRKCTPKRRGPARITRIGKAGAAFKFQGQTSRVARYRVREKVDVQDVGGVNRSPALGGIGHLAWHAIGGAGQDSRG